MGVPRLKMPTLATILLLVSVSLATAADAKKRDPKLFYVSTTTTTSTWFGSTTTSLGTCGKRKRRNIDLSEFGPNLAPKIEPTGLSNEADERNIEDSSTLVDPSEDVEGRKGRFLVY